MILYFLTHGIKTEQLIVIQGGPRD